MKGRGPKRYCYIEFVRRSKTAFIDETHQLFRFLFSPSAAVKVILAHIVIDCDVSKIEVHQLCEDLISVVSSGTDYNQTLGFTEYILTLALLA